MIQEQCLRPLISDVALQVRIEELGKTIRVLKVSQSRKRTVTRRLIAFASSIVSRSVFESWNAKTISWSPFESSSELQMREAASKGSCRGSEGEGGERGL